MTGAGLLEGYEATLRGLARRNRLRNLVPRAGLDFASNDYLGIATSGRLRDPRTIDALFDEVRPHAGQDARFDAMVQHTETLVREAVKDEFFARPMTEAVARVLQGAELLRHSAQEVADVFLNTRTPGTPGAWGAHYGTLAIKVSQPVAKKIMERARISD